MSPRKSSTSSGRSPRLRARYLGIEVAGEPLPGLPPARWTASLEEALREAGTPALPFRLVRSDGRRAIVRVDTGSLSAAKAAWNRREGRAGSAPLLVTRRTWGTLVGAKAWLAGSARRDGTRPGR